MKVFKLFAVCLAVLSLAGCSAVDVLKMPPEEIYSGQEEEIAAEETQIPSEEIQLPEPHPVITVDPPITPEPEPKPEPEPEINYIDYISVTADKVYIRSGAGRGYSAVGVAEKNTLYACLGEADGWCKTQYKNKTAYISGKYCRTVSFVASDNGDVEAVIAEGAKLLGTKYVYGATRYHDGHGKLLAGFTVKQFDCSSLMQYIFYRGANAIIQVNTRTQIYQGTTVPRSQLARGDLMFFTNAMRKDRTGIERVGHVALYLGDGYILHTASDYAKIEKLNALRWSYYIQSQRIL